MYILYACLCTLQCGRTALPNTGVENYKSINQSVINTNQYMVSEVEYGELSSSRSRPDFNFQRQPQEWTRWLRRFERFRQASDLEKKSDEKQVNALIYAMGDEADQ